MTVLLWILGERSQADPPRARTEPSAHPDRGGLV